MRDTDMTRDQRKAFENQTTRDLTSRDFGYYEVERIRGYDVYIRLHPSEPRLWSELKEWALDDVFNAAAFCGMVIGVYVDYDAD